MAAKKRIGRPPGRTHPEAFVVKLPKGTLATWRKAAKREGLSVAEMVRQATAERIAGEGGPGVAMPDAPDMPPGDVPDIATVLSKQGRPIPEDILKALSAAAKAPATRQREHDGTGAPKGARGKPGADVKTEKPKRSPR